MLHQLSTVTALEQYGLAPNLIWDNILFLERPVGGNIQELLRLYTNFIASVQLENHKSHDCNLCHRKWRKKHSNELSDIT